MRHAWILIVAALIGGCVANTPKPARKVDLAGSCASRIEELKRMPLLFPPPVVDGKAAKPAGFREYADWAHCLQSDGARIPAAMFELQKVTLPAKLTLVLQAGGQGTLAAAVSLLDDDMQVMRRYPFQQFVQRSSTYTLDAFLNPADAKVRYVLITPDSLDLGRNETHFTTNSSTVTVPIATGGLFFFTINSEGKIVNNFTDAGRLMINVRPASIL